jgi:6-phosphogluconate dehydrogenase
VKRRNELLTIMDDKEITVQGGNPMTVKGEAASPQRVEAGLAPFGFFFLKISSGGERKARGGASAPFGGSDV